MDEKAHKESSVRTYSPNMLGLYDALFYNSFTLVPVYFHPFHMFVFPV